MITDERVAELVADLERSATFKRVLDDKTGANQAMEIAGALRELQQLREPLRLLLGAVWRLKRHRMLRELGDDEDAEQNHYFEIFMQSVEDLDRQSRTAPHT